MSQPGTDPALGAPTSGASRQAIEGHYDVSRDFYRLWLDSRMVYSCAFWEGELDDDLEAAQLAKLAWHARSAGAQGVGRALDVGCGWGAMIGYLAANAGVKHVTGLTLSSDQASAITQSDQVEVRLEDWRDHNPTEPYDAIISVGAFEHFSRPELDQDQRRSVYAQFFARCASWLPQDGRLSLQAIGWEDVGPEGEGPVADFFAKDIFPESQLPRVSDIVVASEPYLRLMALRSDGAQYSHTLRLWQQRLEGRKDEAIALVGRDMYRRYVRYLRVSRAMFDRHVCSLYRVTLQRHSVLPDA